MNLYRDAIAFSFYFSKPICLSLIFLTNTFVHAGLKLKSKVNSQYISTNTEPQGSPTKLHSIIKPTKETELSMSKVNEFCCYKIPKSYESKELACAPLCFINEDKVKQFGKKYYWLRHIENNTKTPVKLQGSKDANTDQLLLNMSLRQVLQASFNDKLTLDACNIDIMQPAKKITIAISSNKTQKKSQQMSYLQFTQYLKEQYINHEVPIEYKTEYVLKTSAGNLKINFAPNDEMVRESFGILNTETEIAGIDDSKSNINIQNKPVNMIGNELKSEFILDSSNYGVAGHTADLSQLVQSCIFPSIVNPEFKKSFNILNSKGALLYGPPGTGKTAFVRAIEKIYGDMNIPVITEKIAGPEIMSKWIGQSEENLRNLFTQNLPDEGVKLILIDEIDALVPSRGSSDTASSYKDSLVNQFLALLDGLETNPKVLLFATTNRLELIDKALLRPGRLGEHYKFSLPDYDCRKDIFKIHTKKLRDNSAIEINDFSYLAEKTENWSGAEIEEIIRKACGIALLETQIINTDDSKQNIFNPQAMAKVTNIFVTKKHLDKAFMSIKPQNINLTSELLLNTPYTFENFKETEKAQELIETFKAGNTQKNTILIRGKEKSGKTTLALLLARLMGGALSYLPAKDITSHATTQSKSQALICAFDTKPKDAKSVVILDDLTEMLNYHVRLQGHYNSTLDSLIKSQMKESPDSNEKTKILLIATANETIPFLEKLFSDRVIIIDKHSLEYGEPSNNSITRNEEFWQAITSPP